ncbi:MAG: ribosomal protein S18-alanine N-acetyltransferase, partial [candidate division Zixibacteria bacterium]|nr:ribosomal protein S18-alanine N-acetyltransferase [candidate division Zixibacteria bacterium]
DNPVEIRPMTVADLPQILALEREIFSDDWPLEVFEQILEVNGAYSLVVEAGEELIGYACYQFEGGNSHLTNLAVAPGHRRKSVAKRLLTHILDEAGANRCRLMFLEVRPSNAGAVEFYKRLGFEEWDRQAHYYQNPIEDALIMGRFLD